MTTQHSLCLALAAALAVAVLAAAGGGTPAAQPMAKPFWQLHGAGVLPAPEPVELEQLRIAARDAQGLRIAAAE